MSKNETTPIFDAVRADTEIDYEAITSRPRWDFTAAMTRITSDQAYQKKISAKHADIKKKAAANKS